MLKVLCCIITLGTALAHAQVRLTLRDAVAQALASHPDLAAGAERVRATEALRIQAGLRPNPRFIFQTENLRNWGAPAFRFGEHADTYAYGSQLFETGGKRARRVEAAGAGVRRAELERELMRRQIAAHVKQAYWRAASAQKVHDLLRENAANFRQVVEYHEARVREGAMAEADLIRVTLEAERLEIDVNTAGLEADRTRIDLFRQMGSSEFPNVELIEAFEPGRGAVTPDLARALEQRSEVRLASQEAEQARAVLRLEEARGKPDLDVSFGYKRAGGFNTLVTGATVHLPFTDRNQGNIAAASYEVRAAEARLAAEEALVRAEVQAAAREYEIRKRQVTESLPSLRTRAEQSSDIARAAYREGGADLLRLLDAERTRIEAQLLYFKTLAEYHQSRVALETSMGVEQ